MRGEIVCRVEGCPRANPDYDDDVMCGLARLYGLGGVPSSPLCGAEATVDRWIANGEFPL